MNDERMDAAVNEEIEPMLPDGWAEGDDFFNDSTWTGNVGSTNATVEEDDFFADTEPDMFADETAAKATPTEEPTTAQEDGVATSTPSEETAPETDEPLTTEEPPVEQGSPKTYRVKARIDHEDIEADIDLEKDLSDIYQKSVVTDRYQRKLAEVQPVLERLERMAKASGYSSATEMLEAQEAFERESAREKLIQAGTPEVIADDYLDRKYGAARSAEPVEADPVETKPNEVPDAKQEPPARDLGAEVRELLTIRPELRGKALPPEVAAAAAQGRNLVRVYLDYESKAQRAEAENLRKELEIMKQNATSAAKAPVRGVSGGGATDTKPEDPFLVGWNKGY